MEPKKNHAKLEVPTWNLQKNMRIWHGTSKKTCKTGGSDLEPPKKHAKLKVLRWKDPVHKKIMSTKQKLQEDDDYEAQEAIKYAVKKRKYLIQEATGTLSDDELDYDIEDEEEEEMRYA